MRVIPVWTLEMAARLPFLFREPCLFIVGNTDDSLGCIKRKFIMLFVKLNVLAFEVVVTRKSPT